MRSKYCKSGRLPSNLLFMHTYAQKHPTDVYWVAAICQLSVGDAMVSKTQENTEWKNSLSTFKNLWSGKEFSDTVRK